MRKYFEGGKGESTTNTTKPQPLLRLATNGVSKFPACLGGRHQEISALSSSPPFTPADLDDMAQRHERAQVLTLYCIPLCTHKRLIALPLYKGVQNISGYVFMAGLGDELMTRYAHESISNVGAHLSIPFDL